MNYDFALIGKVLENGRMGEAAKHGLRTRFLGPTGQTYWEAIADHVEEFQEVPSPEHFATLFPQYEHVQVADSMAVIVKEIKSRFLNSEINRVLEKVAETNDTGLPWEAKDLLTQLSDEINATVQMGNTDLVAGSDQAEVLKQIEYLRNNGGVLGHRWPWEYLNRNSPGLCNGNFVYFYGREKSRKTFLMVYLANWFADLGLKVLFFTREMTLSEIAWRLYPMRCRMGYSELSAGEIDDGQVGQLEAAMMDLYSRKNIVVTEVHGGMSGIRSKVEEYRPDVVIHDYLEAVAVDMMNEKGGSKLHDSFAKLSGDIKNLAMKPGNQFAFIGCGHANREGDRLNGSSTREIAGTDNIARRADLVLRVLMDEETQRMGLLCNAGRNVQKFLSMTLDATLCNGFGDFLEPHTDWVGEMAEEATAPKKRKKASRDDSDAPPPPSGKAMGKRPFKIKAFK